MFPLWMFGDYNKTVITRGRTQQEAFSYASRNWQRGETATPYPFNFINSG